MASLHLGFVCELKIFLQYGVRPKLLGAAESCTPSFAQHDMASSIRLALGVFPGDLKLLESADLDSIRSYTFFSHLTSTIAFL